MTLNYKTVPAVLLGTFFTLGGFAQPGSEPGAPQPSTRNSKARSALPQGNPSAEAHDPFSFYRRNPELMKRYFPHLAAAGAVPQTPASPAATSPPDAAIIPLIKFDGGTAQDLVTMLKESVVPTPNIMVAPNMSGTEVPPFELQNVTLADLFQALNNLAPEKSAQWRLSGSTEPIWTLYATTQPTQPHPFGNFQSIDPLTGQPTFIAGKSRGRNCQILPIGKYLSRYKVEDITTAVKTAWEMMGEETGGNIKYHKDTQLLIIVGTQEQLGIVSQILSSLDTGMKESPTSATSAPSSGHSAR